MGLQTILQRLIRNAGLLLSGNLTGAFLGLVSFTVAARYLGPDLFGRLALVQTYVLTVDLLFNFQSWQLLIKYGADAIEDDRRDDFRVLLKASTLLDFLSALIAASICWATVPLATDWIGWDSDGSHLARIYSVVILFRLSGTPSGILRLFNRFRAFLSQRLIVGGLKVTGVVIAVAADLGVLGIAMAWILAEIAGEVFILVTAFSVVRMQGFKGFLKAPLRHVSDRFPDLIRFALLTNASTSVRLAIKELDIFFVSRLLGQSSAGIYKVVRELARIPAAFVDPLQGAIYPELARLWAARATNQFFRLLAWSAAGGAVIGTLFLTGTLIFGPTLLSLVFGEIFVAGFPALIRYMIATVLFMVGLGFLPATLSAGRPGWVLITYLVASLGFFGVLPMLVRDLGLNGAAYSQIVFQAVWFVMMILGLTSIRKSLGEATTAEGMTDD